MSIIAAKAIPYDDMLQVKRRGRLVDTANLFPYDNVWIISVTEPGMPPIFTRTSRILPLQFSDYDPEKADMLGLGRWFGYPVVLFNDHMAQSVVRFITKAHQTAPDTKDLLLVNCMMGIARSGAIVTLAKELCELNPRRFTLMNPQIRPNMHVLRLLRAAKCEP